MLPIPLRLVIQSIAMIFGMHLFFGFGRRNVSTRSILLRLLGLRIGQVRLLGAKIGSCSYLPIQSLLLTLIFVTFSDFWSLKHCIL